MFIPGRSNLPDLSVIIEAMNDRTFPTLIHERISLAHTGENPYLVTKVRSGWWVLGDHQFLKGYSVLLADPIVSSINDLDEERRGIFLQDMVSIGDALLHVLKKEGVFRVNYDILGNLDPALHAHIFPRFLSESDERRQGPVFRYSREELRSVPFDAERDNALIEALRTAFNERVGRH